MSREFHASGNLEFIRKNRNIYPDMIQCKNENQKGVDLNRNYDFFFGLDEESSSSNPCAEDYRGPYAFSEPETRAMRDFVTSNKSMLKFAVNFHAYGNLLITPFNGAKKSNKMLRKY